MIPEPVFYDGAVIVDKEGNKLDLRNLHLVVAGSLEAEAPKMDYAAMKSFSIAVAQAATYNQRHLPLWKKAVITYQIFAELFFDANTKKIDDPYIKVAHEWCRQQIAPKTAGERLIILKNRILDMFICSPDLSVPGCSFGMAGFAKKHPLTDRT